MVHALMADLQKFLHSNHLIHHASTVCVTAGTKYHKQTRKMRMQVRLLKVVISIIKGIKGLRGAMQQQTSLHLSVMPIKT